MKFEEYEIVAITPEITDVFLIKLKPKRKKYVSPFISGQFYHMKNPTYHNPHETRQFSVITTPQTRGYIEFCIKTYGPWTKKLLEKNPGESIWLFGPMGQFTLANPPAKTVFIAGGVGITPMLSIIQSLHEKKSTSTVTLLYANKSLNTILRKKHIEDLFKTNPTWKLISLVSEHHGRITEELLQKELDLKKTSIFLICGSQRFTQNITVLLQNSGIPKRKIKQEIFLPPYPQKKD